MGTLLSEEGPVVGVAGFPESFVVDVEDLVVEVGDSRVGVNEVLVDSGVMIFAVHLLY